MFSSLPGPAASTPPPPAPPAPPVTTTPTPSIPVSTDPDAVTPPRDPRGADPTTTNPTQTSAIQSLRATIVRVRCHSHLAVRGWCTVLAVAGTVDADPVAGRTVTIWRRTAAGRTQLVAVRTSSATGTFALRLVIRPIGGVASVLARLAASGSSPAASAAVLPRVRV
jgi:hypothetical protein